MSINFVSPAAATVSSPAAAGAPAPIADGGSKSNGGLPLGAIVGIAVGAAALLALAGQSLVLEQSLSSLLFLSVIQGAAEHSRPDLLTTADLKMHPLATGLVAAAPADCRIHAALQSSWRSAAPAAAAARALPRPSSCTTTPRPPASKHLAPARTWAARTPAPSMFTLSRRGRGSRGRPLPLAPLAGAMHQLAESLECCSYKRKLERSYSFVDLPLPAAL